MCHKNKIIHIFAELQVAEKTTKIRKKKCQRFFIGVSELSYSSLGVGEIHQIRVFPPCRLSGE